jgi:peptidyl-prolyl cis-trans isomerase SurA
MTKIFSILFYLCFTTLILQAQKQNLDKIIAIVGDKIVLKSELENTFADYQKEKPDLPETAKCDMLDQLLITKLLTAQAERDSVIVSDEEVDNALDNRVRYFIQQYGSEEKLIEATGKTIYQIKDDYRANFKEQMQAQRIQQQVVGSVKITPQEIKTFYTKVPQDSLPFYPSMVEVGQIAIKPTTTKEIEDYAKERLNELRADILSGKTSFDIAAGIYSEDPGTKDKGGELGFVTREDLVSEFSAAAFRLQNNEISSVVKTKFGYHIIQMMSKQGEKAKLRHILMKPKITSVDIKRALLSADSVRSNLVAGKFTYSEAVSKFSNDESTKSTGGMIMSPNTGSTLLQNDELDPTVLLMVNDMTTGQYSTPTEYVDQATGEQFVRIIYLKNRVEPHRANLKDDYAKIQQVALAEKQNIYLQEWMIEKIPTFYTELDIDYKECNSLSKWNTKVNKQ